MPILYNSIQTNCHVPKQSGTKRKLEDVIADKSTFKRAIPLLIALLGGADDQKQTAALALANIATCNKANSIEIVSCGGILPLVKMLKGSNEQSSWLKMRWRS